MAGVKGSQAGDIALRERSRGWSGRAITWESTSVERSLVRSDMGSLNTPPSFPECTSREGPDTSTETLIIPLMPTVMQGTRSPTQKVLDTTTMLTFCIQCWYRCSAAENPLEPVSSSPCGWATADGTSSSIKTEPTTAPRCPGHRRHQALWCAPPHLEDEDHVDGEVVDVVHRVEEVLGRVDEPQARPLVVADASAVKVSIHQGHVERRMLPPLRVVRGLDVIVPVEAYRRHVLPGEVAQARDDDVVVVLPRHRVLACRQRHLCAELDLEQAGEEFGSTEALLLEAGVRGDGADLDELAEDGLEAQVPGEARETHSAHVRRGGDRGRPRGRRRGHGAGARVVGEAEGGGERRGDGWDGRRVDAVLCLGRGWEARWEDVCSREWGGEGAEDCVRVVDADDAVVACGEDGGGGDEGGEEHACVGDEGQTSLYSMLETAAMVVRREMGRLD